jgi:hypothetical protein
MSRSNFHNDYGLFNGFDPKINASLLTQISLLLEASKPSVFSRHAAFIGSSPVTKDCSFIKEFRASFWRAAF